MHLAVRAQRFYKFVNLGWTSIYSVTAHLVGSLHLTIQPYASGDSSGQGQPITLAGELLLAGATLKLRDRIYIKLQSLYQALVRLSNSVSDLKLIGPPQIPEREHDQMHQTREGEKCNHHKPVKHVRLNREWQRRNIVRLGV